jgi:hypothetical protein
LDEALGSVDPKNLGIALERIENREPKFNEPKAPCHPDVDLRGVPGHPYKQCPVLTCKRLWAKDPVTSLWNVPVDNIEPVEGDDFSDDLA